jgi:hypothetical protein
MPGKRTAGRRVQLPDYKPQGAAAAPRVPFSTYPIAENMSFVFFFFYRLAYAAHQVETAD